MQDRWGVGAGVQQCQDRIGVRWVKRRTGKGRYM